jgi:hypothetical protein
MDVRIAIPQYVKCYSAAQIGERSDYVCMPRSKFVLSDIYTHCGDCVCDVSSCLFELEEGLF